MSHPIRTRLSFCGVLLALVLSLCACGGAPTRAGGPAFVEVPAAQPAPSQFDDAVQAGDLIEVVVLGQADMTRTVRVGRDGAISLPLIGRVEAAGIAIEELESRIADALQARFLQNPQVSVFVKETPARKVTVSGAVRTPGLYPIDADATLVRAIALAQGFDPLADERAVVVLRPTAEGRTAAVFDVRAIQRGEAIDPALRYGDIVVVEQSGSKTALRRFIETVPAIGVFGLFR